jgi:hypothetical protein
VTDQHPSSNLRLFVDILHTLEAINAPYVIIGAFAATAYGITRATYDIDFIVNLAERHIQALAAHYPSPRYYADPDQMRSSIRLGIMFNIIDSSYGEKADLVPVTMHPRYPQVLANRVRQRVEIPGQEPFEAWYACLEDVIIGKLMAWTEGRSRKHETDIYEMLVFHYLGLDPSTTFNERVVNIEAINLSETTADFWATVKEAARQEADRLSTQT